MRKKAYIYKITNTKTNLSYIGCTTYKKPINRWKKHIQIAKNKTLYLTNKSFTELHQSILDDGIDAFTFEVLEECKPAKRYQKEKYWIKFYDTFKGNGYNRTAGGRGFNGRTHSEETRRKLSEMNKGKGIGSENSFYGRHHTPEAKAKISKANKKKTYNAKEANPFFGKTHSPDTIEKIKILGKARHFKKEWIIKRTKLTYDDIKEIKLSYDNGNKVKKLAEKYKVSIPCIYKVLKKTRSIDK